MMKFDVKFFVKMDFSDEQIGKYFKSAEHNLRIAESVVIPDVVFKFSYDALIKIGITLIASEGLKIKSRMGHHIKILEVIGFILVDKEVEAIGNVMRKKRNLDLDGDGVIVSDKEAKAYLEFVKKVFAKAKKVIFK